MNLAHGLRTVMLSMRQNLWTVKTRAWTATAHSISTQTQAASRCEILDSTRNNEFFNYTRNRFVRDEEYELSQRRVVFDVKALQRVAAAAVGATACIKMVKCVDGMFNKAFILTMNDGQEVIAKLPNPNAGRPHFTTASEVATMDFMRKRLAIPVPEVYAWSSRTDNDVGAEYIIMQRVLGVHLDDVWPKLNLDDRYKLIKNIARFQGVWASTTFSQYGSLYYAEDLGNNMPALTLTQDGTELQLPEFAIGPSTSSDMNHDGRSQVDFDRGPCESRAILTLQSYMLTRVGSTVLDYHKAVGTREARCVRELKLLPRSPITLCGPGLYLPTRESKLKAIDSYLQLVDASLPTQESLSVPCLWHPDLHGENIFVLPDNPTEISGLIDWQSTEIAPLFAQVRQPYFIQYEGSPLAPFQAPDRPPNIDSLDEPAKSRAWAAHFDKAISGAYRTLLSVKYPTLFEVLNFHETDDFTTLLLARMHLVDGEVQYLARLKDLRDTWHVAGRTFPVQFTESDMRTMEEESAQAIKGMELMQRIRDDLGDMFPLLGYVPPEQYEETKRRLNAWKAKIVEEYSSSAEDKEAWNFWWPFDE